LKLKKLEEPDYRMNFSGSLKMMVLTAKHLCFLKLAFLYLSGGWLFLEKHQALLSDYLPSVPLERRQFQLFRPIGTFGW